MRSSRLSVLSRRVSAVGLALAMLLSGAGRALAATTFSSTSITTDNFTALGNITLGDDVAADTIQVVGNLSLTDGQWSVTAAGAATFGDLTVDGGGTNDTLTIDVIGGSTRFAGQLFADDISAARQWILPDGSGTIVLDAMTQTLTNKTLTNPTLTSPRVDLLADSTGTSMLTFTPVGSAVNAFNIATATTGNHPQFRAVGTDTNINIDLVPKGSGVVRAGSLEVTTVSGTQTLTNKTLTSPHIGSAILDTSGAAILTLSPTVSAVNAFSLSNSSVGGNLLLSAEGSDSAIGVTFRTKGSGDLDIESSTATTDVFRIRPAAGGARFTGTLTSADLTNGQTWTLPNATGTIALLADVASSNLADGSVSARKLQSSALDLGASNISVNLSNTNSTFNTSLTLDGTLTLTGTSTLTMSGSGGVVAANGLVLDSSTGSVSIAAGTATAVTIGRSGVALAAPGGLVSSSLSESSSSLFLGANGSSSGSIFISSGAVEADPDTLVLGRKSATGDPTGTDGAMYYNDGDGLFRCFQGGSWMNCIGGGVSGSGAAGAVAFWSGASALTADATKFFWDDVNDRLGIATDNPLAALHVHDETAATTNSVNLLMLEHASTGTTGTGFGTGVMFRAEDTAGQLEDIATLQADYSNATSGAETSQFKFFTRSSGAALAPALTVAGGSVAVPNDITVAGNAALGNQSTDALTINGTSVSAPNGLNVESNILVIDATNDRVGVGISTPVTTLHVSNGNAVTPSMFYGGRLVLSNQSASEAHSVVVASNNGNDIGEFVGVRSFGSLSTPAVPTANAPVAGFSGAIFDGANLEKTAMMQFTVDGTVLADTAPQRISFFTSEAGTGGLTERLRISADGSVKVFSTLAVGSDGTPIDRYKAVPVNFAAQTVSQGSCANVTAAFVGAAPGDTVIATPEDVVNGVTTFTLTWSAYAITDNVVVRVCNSTATDISPAADTLFTVAVIGN